MTCLLPSTGTVLITAAGSGRQKKIEDYEEIVGSRSIITPLLQYRRQKKWWTAARSEEGRDGGRDFCY